MNPEIDISRVEEAITKYITSYVTKISNLIGLELTESNREGVYKFCSNVFDTVVDKWLPSYVTGIYSYMGIELTPEIVSEVSSKISKIKSNFIARKGEIVSRVVDSIIKA